MDSVAAEQHAKLASNLVSIKRGRVLLRFFGSLGVLLYLDCRDLLESTTLGRTGADVSQTHAWLSGPPQLERQARLLARTDDDRKGRPVVGIALARVFLGRYNTCKHAILSWHVTLI